MPLSDRACAQLSRERSIFGRPRAILDYLAGVLSTRKFTMVSTEDLAAELEIHAPDISVALRKLVEIGILIPGPKEGRSRTYRINAKWPMTG